MTTFAVTMMLLLRIVRYSPGGQGHHDAFYVALLATMRSR